MSEFVVVTGMSGAGRSTAAAALEDVGWFVIDNLPAGLIMKMVEMVDRPGPDGVLVRRYEGTRRRHPLAARGVEESIADERKLLEAVRERADLLVDTGDLNSNQLRLRILEAFGDDEA